jgi:hypothetical protein
MPRPASAASLDGGDLASKSEDFCESPGASTDITQQDSRRVTLALSKDATPTEILASNVADMTGALADMGEDGRPVTPSMVACLSPYMRV